MTPPAPLEKKDLLASWRDAWPRALEAWSAYTLLREPRFLATDGEAKADGMAGEIAAIRLRDHVIMVNVEQVRARGLEDHALAILAHEIGHHVYVPGNLTDHGRMIAAITRVLAGLPSRLAHMVANLYGDLLINDRLERRAGIDIASVYEKLNASPSAETGKPSAVWKVYTRAYEHLWRLEPETLSPAGVTAEMDADAALVARVVRSFAGEWLRGARRFAAILYRYLAEDEQAKRGQTFAALGLDDTRCASAQVPGEAAGDAAIPDGLVGLDPSELEDDDGFDESLDDPIGARKKPMPAPNTAPEREGRGQPVAQHRAPHEYGALLRALGLDLSDHAITTRYYRERALPHVIPFPARQAPRAKEPLAEGFEGWGAGDPLEELDVLGSVLRSPIVVPGVTTVKRVYGDAPGEEPARVPMDLDIYVDCSGSMPNPAVDVSYLTLCATILAMSALRAGARVKATLWSGAGIFETTGAFLRDEARVLGTVTGFVSGSTAFPIHLLRDTYEGRKPADPPAHVVVVSDTGIDTILQKDERGNDGAVVCAEALERARGGGTLVLNLPDPKRHPRLRPWRAREPLEKMGFRIHAVTAWEDLVAFARAFVAENYGDRT